MMFLIDVDEVMVTAFRHLHGEKYIKHDAN